MSDTDTDAFHIGDEVLISATGHRMIVGKIEMLSRNQVSALITFDGMIGDNAGMLAVTRHDKSRGIYRSIIDGMEITMRVIPPKQQDGAPDGQGTRDA